MQWQCRSFGNVFTDEARFYLNGHVDIQNNLSWSAGDLRLLHEVPLLDFKFKVWRGVGAT